MVVSAAASSVCMPTFSTVPPALRGITAIVLTMPVRITDNVFFINNFFHPDCNCRYRGLNGSACLGVRLA